MFAAFNAHDIGTLMSFFADDLEFYHDNDGRLSRTQVAQDFTRLFSQNNGLRRDLVAQTLEVHPVPGYGAIELGSHRFCHMENAREDCGVFRFAHVWQLKDGRWRVTRVLSFGHLPANCAIRRSQRLAARRLTAADGSSSSPSTGRPVAERD